MPLVFLAPSSIEFCFANAISSFVGAFDYSVSSFSNVVFFGFALAGAASSFVGGLDSKFCSSCVCRV